MSPLVVQAVTGSGKTLSYVIPTLELLLGGSKTTAKVEEDDDEEEDKPKVTAVRRWRPHQVAAIIISPTRYPVLFSPSPSVPLIPPNALCVRERRELAAQIHRFVSILCPTLSLLWLCEHLKGIVPLPMSFFLWT